VRILKLVLAEIGVLTGVAIAVVIPASIALSRYVKSSRSGDGAKI